MPYNTMTCIRVTLMADVIEEYEPFGAGEMPDFWFNYIYREKANPNHRYRPVGFNASTDRQLFFGGRSYPASNKDVFEHMEAYYDDEWHPVGKPILRFAE